MKKRFAAVFAATAVLGVTTAFAANPFSDVTPNDWAYQAVSQLAAEGVINGYPDGTFKGERNITRYEMAQMVAKAIARQGRVDAEQNAMINRLANEFSSELNNLGVRVGKLENQVGNFKFTGDVRMRYEGSDKVGRTDHGKSQFDYRGRVQFDATVNDNTQATIRLTTGNREFGNNEYDQSNSARIDRVYVQHQFGDKVNVTVGRHDATLAAGLTYDDTFDGVSAKIGTDKLYVSSSFGYLVDGDFANIDREHNAQASIYQLGGKIGNNVAVKGYYTAIHSDTITTKDKDGKYTVINNPKNFYGASLDANFGANDKIWVGGEFAKAESTDHSNAWVAGIGYGAYDIEKAGTWDVKGQYFSLDKNAPVYSSTWNQPENRDWKGWLATVDYAMAKNVGLSAYATIDSQDKDGNSVPEYYRAELNYKF